MSKPITILYLDPEPNNLHAFSAWFRRREEYECHTCQSEAEALLILQRYPVQVLLADQPTPETTGMEFLVRIPAGSQPPVRMVLSAHRELTVLERGVNEGVLAGYWCKTVHFERLEEWIDKLLNTRKEEK